MGEGVRRSVGDPPEHCAYRQTSGPYPEIVDLDNRESESLYVEAYK